MDQTKVGKLIQSLRKEKGLTQKALADAMRLSDRTISKWERGAGCPDVSLLAELSDKLGVNIEKILSGELSPNDRDRGNMKKIKFYACPDCGNLLCATGTAEVSCCGRKLSALEARPAEGEHQITVEEMDDEYYVSLPHPMAKDHFISFIACAAWDRVLLARLYPEQEAAVRLPRMSGGTFYAYCTRHGLVRLEPRK